MTDDVSTTAFPGVGEVAPTLSLTDQTGTVVNLPRREGPTVFVFYRGDW